MSFNYLAIFSAALASVILGGLYGVVFRKVAIALDQSKTAAIQMTTKKRIQAYSGVIIADIGIALVLSYLIYGLEITTLTKGLELAFWVYIGFVIPLTIGEVLWEGKAFKFWLFNAVINAICLFAMVLIITFWR